MIDDLRHLPPRDAFDLEFTPEQTIFWLAILLALGAIFGCSSMPLDLRAHEERHCEGWSHTGDAPFYVWTKTRAASVKPWMYLEAEDTDAACRILGTDAAGNLGRIGACALWQPANCIIILPKEQ